MRGLGRQYRREGVNRSGWASEDQVKIPRFRGQREYAPVDELGKQSPEEALRDGAVPRPTSEPPVPGTLGHHGDPQHRARAMQSLRLVTQRTRTSCNGCAFQAAGPLSGRTPGAVRVVQCGTP